jgi:hypothetical protein
LHVVNFDLPDVPSNMSTVSAARRVRRGRAACLLHPDERINLRDIERLTR